MWLGQGVLHTYLKNETFISCFQAETVAFVPWEASRGEPVPGIGIRDGFPALQGDELGSKPNCRPHGSQSGEAKGLQWGVGFA